MNETKQSAGPLIGSIIIVLLLLAGGYYSLQTSLPSPDQIVAPDDSAQPVPVISAPAKPAQASTEINDIEADAAAVDAASIDPGLDNLDLLVKQ